ncbi:MAG TPA: DegT/DnrJ/EryC1/StrS family aminotransferase [Kofleriaceae bacterium]|jgi:dTDP-4-amino-4,6-dideoxygalactose transaminase
MTVTIPLFDLAAELAPIRADIDAAIKRVLDSGQVIGGPEVGAFEAELAAAIGARHAIGVSSGTDALLAIFMALGIGPGDEVVTTPLTFFATAGTAARLGARIVFADIDDATLTLDPHAAASACSSRTRAVVPVHLFGHPAELPDVPISIVEDAAHAPRLAPRGIASALSFFPTKNLGALGDAGAIVTNDAALADRLAILRAQGARPKYHHVALGGNFRLDAIQAAILRTKLPHLAKWSDVRRDHAAVYRAGLAHLDLRLPTPHAKHANHHFVIRAPRRDALRAHLATAGVATEVYYPAPLHLAPCFAELGYRAGSFPNAERACAQALALPLYPAMTEQALAFVIESVSAFYRH